LSTNPHADFAARAGQQPSSGSLTALHELASRLASQVDSAQREIGETRAILKDAIDRLMPAFTAMRAGDARPVINPSRREAFSALQFQDISDQLLAHAQARLNFLLQEMEAVIATLAAGEERPEVVHQLAQLVASANGNLADLDANLLKPVGKSHLGTGDVELF
jgi:hypothetical protein